MIAKKLAPAKAGVADFSDKIMRKIKEIPIVVVQRYRGKGGKLGVRSLFNQAMGKKP